MTEYQARLRVVAWATERLGATRGDVKHREIIDTYNSITPHPRGYKMPYTADWCAAFVSAAGIACGMAEIFPVECSCGEQIKLLQSAGRWIEDDAYTPKIGDLIYYDWQDGGIGDCKGAADHVGIVIDVTGERITAIEGNKGTESKVDTRAMMVNARYIRGFGCPDYAKLAEPEPCTAADAARRYNTVAELITGAPWAVETIDKLIERGALRGSGKRDALGRPADMDLSADMLRLLVILDRAGALKDYCEI